MGCKNSDRGKRLDNLLTKNASIGLTPRLSLKFKGHERSELTPTALRVNSAKRTSSIDNLREGKALPPMGA